MMPGSTKEIVRARKREDTMKEGIEGKKERRNRARVEEGKKESGKEAKRERRNEGKNDRRIEWIGQGEKEKRERRKRGKEGKQGRGTHGFWNHFGMILTSHWAYFGYMRVTLGSLWHHLGVFWEDFGCMRVALGNFGVTLEALLAHFAVILGGAWFQTTSKIHLTCKIGGLEGLKTENVEKPLVLQ